MHYRTLVACHWLPNNRIEIMYCDARRWATLRRERRGKKGPQVWRLATPGNMEEFHDQERRDFDEWYTKAIAEKYGVGLDWKENRWFVEQIRPTLFNNY